MIQPFIVFACFSEIDNSQNFRHFVLPAHAPFVAVDLSSLACSIFINDKQSIDSFSTYIYKLFFQYINTLKGSKAAGAITLTLMVNYHFLLNSVFFALLNH